LEYKHIGGPRKTIQIKYLVKHERPTFLFLQESKLEDNDLMGVSKSFWKESSGITQSSRGASRGLNIFWDDNSFSLKEYQVTMNWITVELESKVLGERVKLVNIYATVIYGENIEFWNNFISLKESQWNLNSIVTQSYLIMRKKEVCRLGIPSASEWRICWMNRT